MVHSCYEAGEKGCRGGEREWKERKRRGEEKRGRKGIPALLCKSVIHVCASVQSHFSLWHTLSFSPSLPCSSVAMAPSASSILTATGTPEATLCLPPVAPAVAAAPLPPPLALAALPAAPLEAPLAALPASTPLAAAAARLPPLWPGGGPPWASALL